MKEISKTYDLKEEKQYIGLNVETSMTREACGKALVELGEKYKNLIVVTADLMYPTKVDEFASKYPERFFNLGVAEQNMIGVAAGLANSGKIVFATTFAVFATTRACEQVRTDVAYTNKDVKIIGTASGFSFGIGGVTHAAYEDLGIMRGIPNMTVVYPVDAIEAEKTVKEAARISGPFYIRIGRGAEVIINKRDYEFKIGKAVTLKEGDDFTIIATGPMVFEALQAAEILKKESLIDIEVINIHTLKPIDKEAIIKSAMKKKRVITIEEHNIINGLGSSVAEVIAEECNTNIKFLRLGIKDEFPIPGKPDELRVRYNLNHKYICKLIKDIANNAG